MESLINASYPQRKSHFRYQNITTILRLHQYLHSNVSYQNSIIHVSSITNQSPWNSLWNDLSSAHAIDDTVGEITAPCLEIRPDDAVDRPQTSCNVKPYQCVHIQTSIDAGVTVMCALWSMMSCRRCICLSPNRRILLRIIRTRRWIIYFIQAYIAKQINITPIIVHMYICIIAYNKDLVYTR